ncbi:hypothetical protein EAS61_38410 [Bradyrhizobium zhanjiangense]|uniref:Uncharacterized protein n=1 Tax=Bradyrhizobium zhanjiangense TaxID=1325107 RepID=A0A4Q0Q677_9BRAD|nr:hypothetical protein EAS61_38410 [Bradyrhizobium zhanjiangense]
MRAQRSNPESFRGGSLDCFVARAPRNDGEGPEAIAGSGEDATFAGHDCGCIGLTPRSSAPGFPPPATSRRPGRRRSA